MTFEQREKELGIQFLFTLAGGVVLIAGVLHQHVLGGSEDAAGIACAAGGLLLSVPILRKGAIGLLGGGTDTNVLVAVAVAAALALGDYVAAGLVSFFMIVGGLLEERTALGARAVIESLLRLTPTRAFLKDGEKEVEIDAKDLKPGQRVVVRPGGAVPCDGRVVKGRSAVDQSSVTGESVPAEVGIGAPVYAGTVNITGALEVEVEKAGEDTTLGRVQALVMAAQTTRPNVHRLVDAYSRYYTPLVIVLAAAVLYVTREPRHAIATLIVGCPCALVIATPIATIAAMARAARFGILVKNARHLEMASRIDAVVLDKTGTVTTGRLIPIHFGLGTQTREDELLRCAATALRYSSHPIARAAVEAAKERAVAVDEPIEMEEATGQGVRSVCPQGGGTAAEVLVGRAEFLATRGVAVPLEAGSAPREYPYVRPGSDGADESVTVVHVARDRRWLGAIYFEDRVRPEAAAAIGEIKRLGVRSTSMLTGDRRGAAERVGRALGMDEVAAELLPEQKLAFVEGLKRKGLTVAVIGDGVNDAPALAAGHLGVAVGGTGNEVALRTADVVLTTGDLSRLPRLFDLARTARRIIGQNLVLSVGVGLVALVLAGAGWLPPVGASIVHNGAAAFVVVNATRILRAHAI